MDVERERKMIVRQHNDLIQKVLQQDMSLIQQKIVELLKSKIEYGDTDFKTYEFDLRDICRIFGITLNEKNYINLKNNIKKLADISCWLPADDNGGETLFRLMEDVYINPKTKIFRLRFNSYLKPYLIDLKGHYFQYSLEDILPAKSSYMIPLYRLLLSVKYNKSDFEIGLEELKRIISATTYDKWINFRIKALEPAINEINKYSSQIVVDYEVIKTGKAVSAIQFKIMKNEDFIEANQRNRNRMLEGDNENAEED